MRPASHFSRSFRVLPLIALLLPATLAVSPAPPREPVTMIVGRVTESGGRPVASAQVLASGRNVAAMSGADGRYSLRVPRAADGERVTMVVQRIGFERFTRVVALRADTLVVDVRLTPAGTRLEQTVATGDAASAPARKDVVESRVETRQRRIPSASASPAAVGIASGRVSTTTEADPLRRVRRTPRDSGNTEAYERLADNPFRSPHVAPLSTFSVDVDRASYANVRRFLTQGVLPPRDAVRIEELVNYFPYGDPTPGVGGAPLRITTEVAPAPWNASHDLVRVAVRAREVDLRAAPASNLVFLVDVSGSMQGPLRLPLVKQALTLLVQQMREQDRVAIVVYAGRAGLVLPSTSGHDKARILAALDGLEAGGSTAGGAGLRLAYDVARENFLRGGNNRVILCTDGDFNVGQSSDGELVRLIEDRRREGAYLTILGFGMGNYKDAKMEKLAGAGNGNYGYIDDLAEARKLLVTELGGTLHTVAKDVKLQVEFDPTRVQAYRLLGYEDRLLRDEDFSDDARDAGDVGAGHTVTALYEIVRAGVRLDVDLPEVAPLRYQRSPESVRRGGELLHVAMRYKAPDGGRSVLVTHVVRDDDGRHRRPSEGMRFASAVAGFGMLLRESPHAGSLSWQQVVALARGARGEDGDGYRAEFVRLAERAAELDRRVVSSWREREPR